MEKLDPKTDGTTMDIVEENIGKLKELFPDVFTEGKIDFDALKETLGEYLEKEQERYSFTWNGKSLSRRIAQTPSTGTLRPCPDESVNWDTTQNLFIEGDNLEVLKLLQKSYHKKIKMIYIDPPYNTGNEFIYSDNFRDNISNYLELTDQTDEEGRKFSTNTETSGRYHTDWLNMMYPRLKLARNLLSDDGVIFISIDDSEISSFRKLCDEIFGEESFIAQFVWNTEGHTDNQYDVKVNHEYLVLYAKSTNASVGHVVDPNTREESNLWKGFAENSITKNGSANPPSDVILPKGFPCITSTLDLPPNDPNNSFFQKIQETGYITRQMTQDFDVTYPIRKDRMLVANSALVNECKVFSGWANVDKLRQFIRGNCNPIDEENGNILTFYLSEKGVIYYRRDREKARNVVSVLRNMGTTEQMRSALERMGIPFQYPKPKELIEYLLRLGAETGGLVIDFFAGSCTTAHAVFEINQDDNSKRLNFIMVQLPELLDSNDPKQKPGYDFCQQNGLPVNIAEIGKERIRRVIKKIKTEQSEKTKEAKGKLPGMTEETQKLDLGFKVFKLDSSNIIPWDADFDNLKENLYNAVENIKPDRSEADVLYEILLKYGLDLTLPIEARKIEDKTVYIIGAGALVICLADAISLEVVEGIASLYRKEYKDSLQKNNMMMKVVFKDAGFKDDVVKTNAMQILKQAGIEDVKSL